MLLRKVERIEILHHSEQLNPFTQTLFHIPNIMHQHTEIESKYIGEKDTTGNWEQLETIFLNK